MSKNLRVALIVTAVVIFFDQALKVWVKTNMALGEQYRITDWFFIHFVENNGMAFGMEFAGEWGKLFLSIFRIIAVSGIGWYLYKLSNKVDTPRMLIVCVSLVFAGAIGNIIDSAFYGMLFEASYGRVAAFLPEAGGYAPFLHGKVVDMFYFPLFEGNYPNWFPWVGGDRFIFFRPVFNLADSAITVGIAIILICQRRLFPEDKIL
ncbi:lipoprotein signal peptidase [Marinilabiliaceae bacterium ANBcel2]|nr:lipoprotein signal peptidase [Marinilabiliaceae bacterium ANBcel2]